MTLHANKGLATTSLILGLVGWAIYILQWCFDLTFGLLLAGVTAGASAICSTVFDVLPFMLWLVGIVTGHIALSQIKQGIGTGHGRAVWGLFLNYFGLFFVIIITICILLLIGAGIGVGVLDKVLPFLHK
jgi:hypothetical protein